MFREQILHLNFQNCTPSATSIALTTGNDVGTIALVSVFQEIEYP